MLTGRCRENYKSVLVVGGCGVGVGVGASVAGAGVFVAGVGVFVAGFGVMITTGLVGVGVTLPGFTGAFSSKSNINVSASATPVIFFFS